MDRIHFFEHGILQAITETARFDLLTMGRPEGPNCYGAVNNTLRTFLDRLCSQYAFVVVDNEAGMEHLSRRTTNNVDLLCIVAETTAAGRVTARRISELATHLPILVRKTGIIWDKSKDGEELDGVGTLGFVPCDNAVASASMQGKMVFDVDASSLAISAVRKIVERKLMGNVNGQPKGPWTVHDFSTGS